jgi:hypothetical protein
VNVIEISSPTPRIAVKEGRAAPSWSPAGGVSLKSCVIPLSNYSGASTVNNRHCNVRGGCTPVFSRIGKPLTGTWEG